MNKYNYRDDFLGGRFDDVLEILNNFQLSSSEIIPLKTSALTEADMKLVVSRIPQYPFIVTKWQSVVGANNSRVIVSTSENNSDSTRIKKERLQKATIRLLYSKLKYQELQSNIIELIAREGLAVVRFTEDGLPVVDSRFRYHFYWNEMKKKVRLAYLDPKTNQEVAGLTELYDREQVYIIRHPSYTGWTIPLSPAESILLVAKLEFHGLVANQKIFDSGMIGTVMLKLIPEMAKKINSSDKDKEGKNWFERTLDKMNAVFSGARNANKVGYMPGLEDVIEVGKNNRDMQFYELLKDLTPTRIAWNWLLTPTDFGIGGAQTQNNVSVFDDSLFDKFGQHIERQLDTMRNDWLLPAVGVRTSESFYIEYVPPEDPKKLEEIKQALEEYKNNAITLNEFREKKGLPSTPEGDVYYYQLTAQNQQPVVADAQTFVDAQIVQPKRIEHNHTHDFLGDAREYRATNTEKALALDIYDGKKGFLTKLQKAINKQLIEYVSRLSDMSEVPKVVELKPLETYYSFPAIKKDMLAFAGFALDTVKKDKRTSFALKRDFFDGEYPQSVIDFIDKQAERLLKGDEEFKSVDVETANQIETLINANISLGVDKIAGIISDAIPTIDFNRASLIAQTEVANAVEGTREIMYTTDPLFKKGGKSWQTSKDEKVRESHQNNEKEGIIPIKKNFQNGFSRAGSEPRCRCDTLYYTKEEM
jgi:hypothetical protein